jgi:predicted transcriptional regulator
MSNSIKDEVISLIKKLPEDTTLEEIMYHLYVRQQIMEGLQDIEQGKVYSLKEIKEMSKQWILNLQKEQEKI